ncbi:Uncharacterised protein [Mycobacteroides abscessus subsp. abscessus]|nr:Uncharacterised protein [Mycobacteroides abscessus subsp. abscessus]
MTTGARVGPICMDSARARKSASTGRSLGQKMRSTNTLPSYALVSQLSGGSSSRRPAWCKAAAADGTSCSLRKISMSCVVTGPPRA